jgi:hypothetical protein
MGKTDGTRQFGGTINKLNDNIKMDFEEIE